MIYRHKHICPHSAPKAAFRTAALNRNICAKMPHVNSKQGPGASSVHPRCWPVLRDLAALVWQIPGIFAPCRLKIGLLKRGLHAGAWHQRRIL